MFDKATNLKAAALTQSATHSKPEFIRLPLPGKRCPYTGLSRSTLNELTIASDTNDYNPPVDSKVLRKRGATRGIRLINFDSLISYLNELPGDEEVAG
ncbi:MAG: hypothetical protein Q7P63_11655 [Verrucomicrobiota bacterium JB022]|nr:hypothetical protein [Verrucomicrobiota bacterium JB022]